MRKEHGEMYLEGDRQAGETAAAIEKEWAKNERGKE
jgi:hypothetical protein